jgi:hypothetical protein
MDYWTDDDPRFWFRHESLWFEWQQRGLVRVCGTEFTAQDHPECLDFREFDCADCTFVFEDEETAGCYLDSHPELRSEALAVLETYLIPMYRRREIVLALEQEMLSHGRALHYTVLAQIVHDRHPEMETTESSVLGALRTSHKFERLSAGLYSLARGHDRQ